MNPNVSTPHGRGHALGSWCSGRVGHYLILIATGVALTIPALGVPSLWDMDEGLNAEASREMVESGDWIVPTFNGELRTAKPVLLYWLQAASYSVLGVSEFAARLPSALALLVTMLLTYELGRRLFDPTSGLLAGFALGSSILTCVLAHAATPDAVLLGFTVLTYFLFWRWFASGGQGSLVPVGVAAGLAVLTKGPVGVALPGLAALVFLLTEGRLRWLFTRRLLWASVAFAVTAGTWYVLVGILTEGRFLREFFIRDNVNRFLSPMEGHEGPVFYHLLVLVAGFFPWSIFVVATLWYSWKANCSDRPGYRFLLVWLGIYLVFFSVAATKLPNYILPAFPPLALLTGNFLARWWRGEVRVPRWLTGVGLVCLGGVGIAWWIGVSVLSGEYHLGGLETRPLPNLSRWAFLGMIPFTGALVGAFLLWKDNRVGFLVAFSSASVLFVGSLPVFVVPAVDEYKASRQLVREAELLSTAAPDSTIGAYRYTQPSIVFYHRGHVEYLADPEELSGFLKHPGRLDLFLLIADWEELQGTTLVEFRPVAEHWDLSRSARVVVVRRDDLAGTSSSRGRGSACRGCGEHGGVRVTEYTDGIGMMSGISMRSNCVARSKREPATVWSRASAFLPLLPPRWARPPPDRNRSLGVGFPSERDRPGDRATTLANAVSSLREDLMNSVLHDEVCLSIGTGRRTASRTRRGMSSAAYTLNLAETTWACPGNAS